MKPPQKKSDYKSTPPIDDTASFEVNSPVSRESFLSLSRNYLSILKKSLVDFRSKGSEGRAFVQDYSRIVDSLVGVLFQRAIQEHGIAYNRVDIAIVGMGGYGREELAPYSDVDILILCKRKTRVTKLIASSFIRLMWDVGFELGHAVESLVESESTLARHMDTRTALFESRWICGSRKIAREVETQIRRLRKKDREAFLSRKIKDAVSRHARYSNRYQLIEPNVKVSPGGLRDFQTLVWLGMVLGGQRGLAALRKKGLLLHGETAVLESAYDFLLRVRVELHLATESKEDQLTVGMQKVIAERLGYKAKRSHLGVELFMRDYYNHTRAIYTITEDIMDELHYGKRLDVLLGRKKVPRAVGKLSLRVDRSRIKREPLYLFVRQKKEGVKLHRTLKRRLEVILKEDLSGKAALTLMRHSFPRLLEGGTNVSLVLRTMHETGFLGTIIPEYNDLTSLKRYDLYHHYTVDEHSFQVVYNVEQLANMKSRRLAPMARIYSEISNKHVLFLAALLHDIGKIEGAGHAKKGAALSQRILKRMGVEAGVIDTVCFLIEIHLLMSHFSQRRDPTDIGTLRSFCKKVRNRSNLKYLCLLTYADLDATSPVVWTEWKRSLLWTLYLSAYRFMAQAEKEPDVVYKARKKALLRSFASGTLRQRALEHLDMLPGRYLLTMNASQVKAHMELVAALDKDKAIVSKRKIKLATEITFCTHDKPYRLSQLCGVLTLNDCNILFAYAFTRTDGKVLDVFYVEDIGGVGPIDDARIDKVRRDLNDIVGEKIDIHDAVEKHVQKWKRQRIRSIPVPLRVEFENDLSGDVTIVDIFAMDQPGLLFKIARALSEEGLTIHRARISTEANRAIDSFDVQDKKTRKVTAIDKLRQIRKRLETALA
ncbi:MAG: [protein-PII] uridylyltransferase [Candidatus Krumholzibacteria bacterium]|nr:[protein-PII] uridylyltransferase [Candidatus Krumholzibacteria bacterium]